MRSKGKNLVILDGSVTDGPHFLASLGGGFPESIDFELKTGAMRHQVVSVEPEIVTNRDTIDGRIRVFGKLTERDGDSVILAQRIEHL